MAESLPSSPVSHASPQASSDLASAAASDLTLQLDNMLEQYLELLDQYTSLREQLSKQFSEGFFSLASAQRTSNLGPGRRYGQDGYDRRMKALRRVEIEEGQTQHEVLSGKEQGTDVVTQSHDGPSFQFTTVHIDRTNATGKGSALDSKKFGAVEAIVVEKHGVGRNHDTENAKEPVASFRDPVTWYGILVPTALRQTQQCFMASVGHTLPELATVRSRMESTEQQVWKLREKLGISDGYRTDSETEPLPSADPLAEIDKLLAKAKLRSEL